MTGGAGGCWWPRGARHRSQPRARAAGSGPGLDTAPAPQGPPGPALRGLSRGGADPPGVPPVPGRCRAQRRTGRGEGPDPADPGVWGGGVLDTTAGPFSRRPGRSAGGAGTPPAASPLRPRRGWKIPTGSGGGRGRGCGCSGPRRLRAQLRAAAAGDEVRPLRHPPAPPDSPDPRHPPDPPGVPAAPAAAAAGDGGERGGGCEAGDGGRGGPSGPGAGGSGDRGAVPGCGGLDVVGGAPLCAPSPPAPAALNPP